MINILDLFSAHFGFIFDPVEPGINILDLQMLYELPPFTFTAMAYVLGGCTVWP